MPLQRHTGKIDVQYVCVYICNIAADNWSNFDIAMRQIFLGQFSTFPLLWHINSNLNNCTVFVTISYFHVNFLDIRKKMQKLTLIFFAAISHRPLAMIFIFTDFHVNFPFWSRQNFFDICWQSGLHQFFEENYIWCQTFSEF